jgi:hypothetical protein
MRGYMSDLGLLKSRGSGADASDKIV